MEITNINKLLIDLAKGSIYDVLYKTKTIDKNKFLNQSMDFNKQAATFVTLTLDHNLRGCIGSLIAHRSLFDDITSNAISAAFKDPRFPPLTKEEFEKIELEISLLSEPVEVIYSDFDDLRTKLIPKKHGVILKSGFHQATFLPQVWEQLPSFDLFFDHLYTKAGLQRGEQAENPQIFTYTVKLIK